MNEKDILNDQSEVILVEELLQDILDALSNGVPSTPEIEYQQQGLEERLSILTRRDE